MSRAAACSGRAPHRNNSSIFWWRIFRNFASANGGPACAAALDSLQQQQSRIQTGRTELATRIGHVFANPALLNEATRHRSYINEHPGAGSSNQRLEFLGDRVLDLVLAQRLFSLFPHDDEGELARMRDLLVSGVFLTRLGEDIRIIDAMELGAGEQPGGNVNVNNRLIGDAFEALIGAVYLDGGLPAAERVILSIYGDIMARLAELGWHVAHGGPVEAAGGPVEAAGGPQPAGGHVVIVNPKGKLQELCQRNLPGNPVPRYEEIGRDGEDHRPTFLVEVSVPGLHITVRGIGPTKRKAEEQAATNLLRQLFREP